MPCTPQRTSGQRKYLATNSTATAFTAAEGRVASANITRSSGALILNADATQRVIQLGHYRGARIQFFGAGTNDTTANYRIWTAHAGFSGGESSLLNETHLTDLELRCFVADTSTVTLSTATGVASGLLVVADVMCDTITMTLATTATTPRGPGTVVETAYQLGNATAYSPANNVRGELVIPDFGGAWGFLIDFDMTGATSMNAAYELTA